MAELTSHGACGKTWKQRGNRTGHCGKCHETFEGLALFDAHQRIDGSGNISCLLPWEMKFRGAKLRMVEGSWRGPALPAGTFGTATEEAA